MRNSFFTTNIWLKIFSLIMATVLWFFVILSGRSEISMNAPITFTNIPPQLEVVDSPDTVSVVMEGQERLISRLRQNEISAVIDLSQTKAGRSFFTLTKDNIKVPKNFAVKSIDPETISIKIEPQLKKTVSVKPAIAGLPEKGYAIVEVSVTPKEIELEGPKSIISKIYKIKTEPIDISGINADHNFKPNLALTDINIKKSLNKVEVNITVKKID
jgi:YbbR domain-containing protein